MPIPTHWGVTGEHHESLYNTINRRLFHNFDGVQLQHISKLFEQRCDHGYLAFFELNGHYNADGVFRALNFVCGSLLYLRVVLSSEQNGHGSTISTALHKNENHDFVIQFKVHIGEHGRYDVACLRVPDPRPRTLTIDRYAHRTYQVVFKTMDEDEFHKLLRFATVVPTHYQ